MPISRRVTPGTAPPRPRAEDGRWMMEEEKYEYPSSVVRRLRLRPSDIISQIQNLLIGDRGDDVGHGRVVAVAGIVLVAAQRLDQIIFALGGDAGDVLLPGK